MITVRGSALALPHGIHNIHINLEDFSAAVFSYAPMAPGALGRGEIWALNRSIKEYGEMPPYNSQIPGDTRYKR